MTPREQIVYEVVGLLRKKVVPPETKEQCTKAVEELMSEHTKLDDHTTLGYRFDALNCNFARFAGSVWTLYFQLSTKPTPKSEQEIKKKKGWY
jgi:hypothetical protein